MIPLTTFNAAKVLDGARVPLVHLIELKWRCDWIADEVLCRTSSHFGNFTVGRNAPVPWDELALDPTDAGTARLIDRRVAEAQFKQPMPDIVFTLAVHTDRLGRQHFALAGMDNQGQGYLSHVAAFPVSVGDLLADLPSLAANLPEARARLLCALYPPVPA